MTLIQEKAKVSQVETLAKLYLEGDPAEICDATLAELRDWLWGRVFTLWGNG